VATLTVRKLADETYTNLGKRAKANNRSLEAEVRDILDREAKAFDIHDWVADLRALKRANPIKLAPGEDAVTLLRKERDSW
jgi:plasmid stability protein